MVGLSPFRVVLLIALFVVGSAAAAHAACDTALLVIDVQNMFLGWQPWITAVGEDIVSAVSVAIDAARASEVPIIYIRDIALDRRGEDQETLAIPDAIAPEQGDAVFTKMVGDAMTNPDLVDHLDENGIRRLLISGISSDGCVQSTLYSAYRAGYELLIVTDAHAHSRSDSRLSELMNRAWLGRGFAGQPTAEIDWASFSCSHDTGDAGPDGSP